LYLIGEDKVTQNIAHNTRPSTELIIKQVLKPSKYFIVTFALFSNGEVSFIKAIGAVLAEPVCFS
jgi:hypothetical protein